MKKIEKIILKNKQHIIKEILWNSDVENTKKIISLTEYIDNNSFFLRKKLLKTINDIENQNSVLIKNFNIENQFNFWFLTNFREKTFYKKNKFFELTKILSIIEICKPLNFDEVIIIINDKIYRNVLLNIFKEKKISKNIFDINFSFDFFYDSITEVSSFLKGCKFLFSKFFFNKIKHKVKYNDNLFISFFTYINKKSFNENKYKSLFWDNIQNLTKVNFLHLFISNEISNNFNHLNNKISKLEKNNETHGFLDGYINFKMIIQILFKSLQIKYKFLLKGKKMKLNYDNYEISNVISFDLKQNFLFFSIIIKLYYFYLFKYFFKKNEFNSKCFYIHENQPWEKSLIYHWKKNNSNKIYGVLNSAIRFWDLRVDISKLRPDFLLVNGDDSFKKALDFGHLPSELKIVESLRYKEIVHTTHLKKNNTILIILDYLEKSNSYLLDILNNTTKLFDYEIIFKDHPLNKLKNIKSNFKYKKYDEFLGVNTYDLVICTNQTNASIDYILAGHNVAVAKEPDHFNFSPLKDNKECKFFKNSNELTDILINLNYCNKEEKKNTFFRINHEYKEWIRIFNEKN